MHRAFAAYKRKESRAVDHAARLLKTRCRKASELPPLKSYLLVHLQEALSTKTKAPLSVPPQHVVGDLAVGCFALAKELRKGPPQIAAELAPGLKELSPLIDKAQPVGPYVNLFLQRSVFTERLLRQVEQAGADYGRSRHGEGAPVVVDFSSPNIAKPLGIGHLRSTIIGAALARLYAATGFAVITDNHIGDWGTQFGKLIVAHDRWNHLIPGAQGRMTLGRLMELYVKFHREAANTPGLEDEARAAFARVEGFDDSHLKLWLEFRALSLKRFEEVYKQLGVSFDLTLGESFYNDGLDAIVNQALQTGLAGAGEDGAIAADLKTPDLPTFLLRKRDGSSLYMTRDLATIRFRAERLHARLILYVVGQEQTLHFRQCFAAARQLGLGEGVELRHIPFGLILTGGAKMSTREGTLVGLEEVLTEATVKARQVIVQKNAGLKPREQERVAAQVGIGSVIYNDLSQSREKNISFDWDRMLDFRGGSAPYLQYTCVRIESIFNKIGKRKIPRVSPVALEHDVEWEIVKKLAWWPLVLIAATEQVALHPLATYLEELAGLFHQFYQTASVKDAAPEFFPTRVRLIKAVAVVIRSGLGILGISAPERM